MVQSIGSRLAGKTALVTGATSNIGRAIAVAFAAEGAHVLVAGRNETRGKAVVAEIEAAGGQVGFISADLDGSAARSHELAADATRRLGGRIDILVNNAGIYPGATTPDTDEATFDQVYAVNVKAPFFLTAAVAPGMAAAGGGTIINLGSWIARLGIPVGALYSSSKGAMETLTRAWAAEFGPSGVRVNAISPGVVHELGAGADRGGFDDGWHPGRAARHPGRHRARRRLPGQRRGRVCAGHGDRRGRRPGRRRGPGRLRAAERAVP